MTVRHYKLVLTTVGPVHIGNGSEFSGKDYFRLDNKRLAILDASKFVGHLSPTEVEAHCAFLETKNSNYGLTDFLAENPSLRVHARTSIAYEITMGLTRKKHGSFRCKTIHQRWQ